MAIISGATLNGNMDTAGGGGADVFASWTEDVAGTSTIIRNTTDQDEGTACCELAIDGSNSLAGIRQTVLTIGRLYRATIRAKASSGSPTLWVGDSGSAGQNLTLTTSYALYTVTFTAGATVFQIKRASAASKSLYVDLVTLDLAINTLIGDGVWSNVALWDQGHKPTTGECVDCNGHSVTLDENTAALDTVTALTGSIDFAGYTMNCNALIWNGSGVRSTTGAGILNINAAFLTTSLDLSGANGTWGFTGAINFAYAGAVARTYHWGTSRTIPNAVNLASSTNVNYFQCVTAVTFSGQHTYTPSNAIKFTSGATYNYALKPIIVGGSPNAVIIGGSTLNGNLDTAGTGTGTPPDTFANWVEAVAGTSTVNRDTSNQYEGVSCCRLDVDSTGGFTHRAQIQQDLMTIGKRYRLSLRAKASSGTPSLVCGDSALGQIPFTLSTEWTQYSAYFTATATILLIRGQIASTSFYIDAVTLQESNEIELFSSTPGSPATLNYTGVGYVQTDYVDILDVNALPNGNWFYGKGIDRAGTGWRVGWPGPLVGSGGLVGDSILVGSGRLA